MRGIGTRLSRLEAGTRGRSEQAVAQACTLLADSEIGALTDLFERPGLPVDVGRDDLLEHAREEEEVQAVRRFWELLEPKNNERTNR